MTFAAVLAGGIGSRMGAEMPKQYLEVGGKPILVRSVEQFACREDMACVLVLTPEDWVSYTRDLLLQYGMGPGDVPVTVLTGGATRNDTLRNAIDYLEKHFELGEDSVFVTHDAVRPFLTQRIIAYRDRCFAVHDYSAAIENMLLAIVALGYQSCWYEGHITDVDRIGDKMARILGVPEDYELVCLLPVGVAADLVTGPKKKSFSERAWFNGFGKE